MFLPLSAAGFSSYRAADRWRVIVPSVSFFAVTGMPPMTIPLTGPIMMLESRFPRPLPPFFSTVG